MSLFEKAAALEKGNKTFALVTITSSKGSAPRSQGRMIVLPDRTSFGTIGGGKAEEMLIRSAVECLKVGDSRSVSYKLDSGKSEKSIDMVCGGDMEFFIEVFLPKPSLFLTGGGHVNLAVSRLADYLGYPYVVADTRPEMVSKERFPSALDHITGASAESLLQTGIDRGWISNKTALLIATHEHDVSALREALQTSTEYIGLLGSKKKVKLFFQKMTDAGFTQEDLDRVYAPVGLDFGTETPEEISLSILAEIMQQQNRTSGKSLSLSKKYRTKPLAIIRGAGDLATGTISKLHRCGFRVAALDMEKPTVIRRTVAFAQSLVEGEYTVEGIKAVQALSEEDIHQAWESGNIPVLPDPDGEWIKRLKPEIVVDAIIAKSNCGGTRMDMAPVVIGLGPGFTAGKDVHAVIETNRGHNLGKIIREGQAEANTGVPGNIAGFTAERVVRAPSDGIMEVIKDIGSLVKKGDLIARAGKTDVFCPLDGVVRGMIAEGTPVTAGFKIADVDPRGDDSYCRIISDKARAIAGGVLEAILILNPSLLSK